MTVLKYGCKALLPEDTDDKAFRCEACSCLWVANSNEYFAIRTPVVPNIYSYCPMCGSKTWRNPMHEFRFGHGGWVEADIGRRYFE